jgi:Rha family phage regulatory protein
VLVEAEIFLRHDAVLRAIDNLECDAEFTRLNFAPCNYVNGKGRTERKIVMTRDGFAFLVMGFTGKRAAEFKQGLIYYLR